MENNKMCHTNEIMQSLGQYPIDSGSVKFKTLKKKFSKYVLRLVKQCCKDHDIRLSDKAIEGIRKSVKKYLRLGAELCVQKLGTHIRNALDAANGKLNVNAWIQAKP